MARISLPSVAALGIIGLAGFGGFTGCASNQGGPGSGGNGGRGGSTSSGAGGSGNVTTSTTGAGGGTGGSSGGSGGSGVTTGAGGAVTTTGAGGAGGAGMSCTLPTVGETCAGTVPQSPLVINFARYMPTGSWGNSAMGDLTGGTSPFQGAGVTPLVLAVEGADPDARLHVTGTIPVSSYAGFVLWFGPCVNASTFMDTAGTPTTTGIAAVLGGSLGGSNLKFQVQTAADYPVDAPNMKGACLFTNCDQRWSQCVGPTALMTTIPGTPALTTFPWAGFTGGSPTATTNGNGVVGLQFQWECVAPPSCNVDVSIGTIILTTN